MSKLRLEQGAEDIVNDHRLYSPSVFSLTKSLLLILKISSTYRFVSYLIADYRLISRLSTIMHDFQKQCQIGSLWCFKNKVQYFFKTIIWFGFCDIRNKQDPGKYYQPHPLAQMETVTLTSTILNIRKTSSNKIIIIIVYNTVLTPHFACHSCVTSWDKCSNYFFLCDLRGFCHFY